MIIGENMILMYILYITYNIFIYHYLNPYINKFKHDSSINTILLGKVGDNAIDIPIANDFIQISFNFASRRQEAQRLGRIIRPKNKANEKKNINDPKKKKNI
ncbi:hypothetical protein PFNF54_03315 [Plasmodium falciparum NF54]|uniref:ERCC3/RAD25/XPB helicase C-terminal domain-containing protein n=1 Tax=Plasmodium falciparum (isolate NF54) TaxID=5843 RepID=W7K4I9_PLAFO|nr:hypothetical protein PFNF54_03315 [Plasmodium falciparum NF54]